MFITRLLSGIGLLILSWLFVYLGGIPLAAVLLVLSVIAYFEMGRALKLFEKKQNAIMIWGYIAITGYYCVLAFTKNPQFLVMAAILGIIGFLCVYVFSFPKYEVSHITGAIYAFMYAPIMLSFMGLTRSLENGFYLVWIIYISAWGSDTLAYCVGMLFGKTIGNHKMTPKLSPKKSIEGAVGGILGAALLAWLYGHFIMGRVVTDIPNLEWMLAIIGACGGACAMIGDLAASAVKRNTGIKDFGHCIPGHGGILDRFDSMIFTAPLTYFLVIIIFSVERLING
ncbi:MAG: phosphatidate cytidylyltransferase [Lachnospiraceae bacterium]|nr:phosphatidate cytidylyltransferase [Lachnospiraceae bacterium]